MRYEFKILFEWESMSVWLPLEADNLYDANDEAYEKSKLLVGDKNKYQVKVRVRNGLVKKMINTFAVKMI